MNDATRIDYCGYADLYGPSRNISMLLEEAKKRGKNVLSIPFDAPNPIKIFSNQIRDHCMSTLLLSHTDSGNTGNTEALAKMAKEKGLKVIEVEDIPEKALNARSSEPYIDTIITAGNWYKKKLQDVFPKAQITYPGIPVHLQEGTTDMKKGSEARRQSADDTFYIHVPGMKDLRKDLQTITAAATAASEMHNAQVTYLEHRGTDAFYRDGDPPAEYREQISNLATYVDALNVSESANVQNTRAFHCGYAGQNGVVILAPSFSSTESISAAHLGIPTITLQTEASAEWYINKRNATAYIPPAELIQKIKDLQDPEKRNILRSNQEKSFPREEEANKSTAQTVIDMLES